MSDSMMDTVPGGETPQYESIQTVTKPTPTQSGQLGDGDKDIGGSTDVDQQKREKGERMAENVRYGQNISESGMGGKTTGNDGVANQAEKGGTASDKDEQSAESRKEQGYGEGSGVGG